MIKTSRFLGYRRISRKVRHCCRDLLAGQNINEGMKNEELRMDVESIIWIAVKHIELWNVVLNEICSGSSKSLPETIISK